MLSEWEAVQKRISCRSFEERFIEAEKLQKLKRNKNPGKLGTDLPDFPTDRRFAAGESSLFDQAVIDSFCRMFLFPETRSFIFLKAGTDKSRDIILDDRRFAFRSLAVPWKRRSITVLGDSISGDSKRFCYMSLAFAGQKTLTDFFVILHSNNHL